MVPNKNAKYQKKGFPWLAVSSVIVLGMAVAAIYIDYAHPVECVKSATVQKILSVNYRSATILLDNGETHVVHQESLQPGSPYCLKYDRK